MLKNPTILVTFILFTITTIIITLTTNLHAIVSTNDDPYNVYEKDNYEYIFPDEYKNLLPWVIQFNDLIKKQYISEFSWTLDSKTTMILTSSRNQIANGFATVIPFNLTVFYGGGASMIDLFAEKSWLEGLISHESAHLYQLNTKQGLAKIASKLFGNNIIMVPNFNFPLWIFPTPNIAIPLWILEGNAVYNESRFGNGGRLYSGEQRALFYTLLHSDLITEERIINDHIHFPGAGEKYIVGGYFTLFLAQKFGANKINRFFLTHSKHWINPMKLDQPFMETFGYGIYQLFYEFIKTYKNPAKLQVRSKEKSSLAETIWFVPMNRIGNTIYFMTFDGISYPKLVKFNVKTGETSSKSVNMPMGKIFKVGGKLYSASSGRDSSGDSIYSLWGEGGDRIEKYDSKIVLDINNGKTLYFDAKTSYMEPRLFLDNDFKSVCHSSGMLDSQNNYYCFKQNGKTRTLYKNKKPVFEFKGHYGKIVDIAGDRINFIASTNFGSSLFEYDGNSIFRLSNLDTIVDSKKISKNEFLITEVTNTGYQYKKIKTKPINDKPYEYTYFFEKLPEYNLSEKVKPEKIKIPDNKLDKYGPISHLRFNAINFTSFFGGDGNRFDVMGSWVDPFLQSMLLLTANINKATGKDQYELAYQNSRRRLEWTFFVNYTERYKAPLNSYWIDDEVNSGLELYLPFIKKGSNTFYLSSLAEYEIKDEKALYEFFVGYRRYKFFSRSFFPYRDIKLEGGMEINRYRKSKTNLVHGHLIHDVGSENIFSFDFEYLDSDDHYAVLGERSEAIPHDNYSFLSLNNKIRAHRLGASYGIVINKGIYFSIFPISLRRFAPKIFINHFHHNSGTTSDFQQLGYGMDAELLVAHRFPIIVGFSISKTRKLNKFGLNMWLTSNF